MDIIRNVSAGWCCDDYNAILMLREVADKITSRILMSTMNSAKTASEICSENKLPLSSTYKKILKLHTAGLISIEKIGVDGNGKKVIYYKSNVRSLEFNLNEDGLLLQFNNR
jgi:predicted transcriptional regulator